MNIEKINVNSMEYRKLSKEDKLKVVNFKINEILNDKDPKKVYEYYCGKKVGVPKSKDGIFRDLCERKRALEKTIVSYSDELPVNENIETKIVVIDKQINTIKQALDNIFNMYKLDEYKKDIIRINYRGEYKFIPYDKLSEFDVLNKRLSSLEEEKRKLESKRNTNTLGVIESENEEPENIVTTNYEYFTDDGNPYESGYMLFPTKVSSSENKNTELAVINHNVKDLTVINTNTKDKNIKDKKFSKFVKKLRKNKVKTAICALILAATTVVCGFLPKSNNKKHDTSSVVTPTSVSETTTPINTIINDEKETIIEEPTKTTEVENVVVENEVIEDITDTKEYELGESVTLCDNSYIYTNSYDATSETNSYIPYYDNSYDREVVGVTYELDGQLYTIYKYDNDAINRVDELINKGAKQTAVLVVRSDLVNTGNYEGYYNIDSVRRVKTR